MRTWEQRLKFDYGLPVGLSLVEMTKGTQTKRVLVEIGKRGKVSILPLPEPHDMYTGWLRVRGDTMTSEGGIVVWAARKPEFMQQFEGEPKARIVL